MIKKINILVLFLLVLLSIGAVSASDDVNLTDDGTNLDILEASDFDDEVSISDEQIQAVANHTVTQDTYGKYFASGGDLIESTVNDGDTIYLDGSFQDLKFSINKQVNIVGTSTNNMKNSMITLLSGASGSSISNLNIANTKGETYGIFLNSASYCTIKDCTIKNTGKASYCICLANGANYNNVTDNDLKCYGITYGHGTRSTPTLILSGSHHNYVANNKVESDDANGIYLSSYAGGPLKGGESNFNIIYNNTVQCDINILPTSWCYNIQIMGNNNTIKANKVIRGYRGISTAGSGNIIMDNVIVNITGADYNHLGVETGGEYAIVAAYDSKVINNTIIDCKIISTGAGISAIDNSIVEDNLVNVTLKGRGITAGGSNVIIRNNVIFTELGSGIYEKDEGSGLLVDSNNVTSVSGIGVLIEKLNNRRMPKNVTVINNVIVTGNKVAIDAAGVQEGSSNIDLDSNEVFKKQIITPSGNIDMSKPTYIFKGNTLIITPSNIREYINDNGGLTSLVSDNDILSFEGTFENEIIYVTKSVKITGKNPVFYNSTFKVTCGNVLIENLTIINNEAERVNAWGIFVNQALGVRIMNNKISVSDPKAAYAIYVLQSSDIDVWNNELSSQGEYLTFTLLSYACEECSFANNTIKTIGTGEAYTFEVEKCIDGNELVIDGKSYCLDGNELVIDGKTYCLDGNELVIDGRSYCLDGNELTIDGTSYCIDGEELVIDGVYYNLINSEISINGTKYCLDGNELSIDGVSYCLDGNELVIDGTRYCVDGNEYCMDGAHVVQEIYRTYGILLLYSSNNTISGNDVNVTSNLDKQYPTTGNGSSTNSIVGIDLYYNSHNNVFINNNVFVKGNDNYLYGMGVLGYYTGHNAPEGQGATNNQFEGNTITIVGPYFATGLIVGDESEGTVLKDNVVNLNSDGVSYGITLEMSQRTSIINNTLKLNSQVIYGIEALSSSDNNISKNNMQAEGKKVYAIIISNGKDNVVLSNIIYANGNGQDTTIKDLDFLGSGNAGVYLKDNSTDNIINDNHITSTKGYAVSIDDAAVNNVVQDNYLNCEKGIGNKAVDNVNNNNVSDNYKYVANVTVSPVTVSYLGIGRFTLTFDKSLDGAIVRFYDSDNQCFNETTVSNGVATVNYKFDESYIPAQYVFSAKLIKEDYRFSTFDLKVTVNKGNISITLQDAYLMQGSSGDIVAKLVDELGNPIVGALVEFNRFNSAGRMVSMGNALTNGEGIATLSYSVPVGLATGKHTINAEVSGVANYEDSSVLAVMEVVSMESLIGGKDYSVYYGNTVQYQVSVIGTDGKSVGEGKEVTFEINGLKKVVKTDNSGNAVYPVKLKAGAYTITATYEGYSVSNKITFKPILTAKDISKKKAKKIKFSVKLVNKKGKVLKNKKITFKIKNKKYTAKTNKKGVATISIKNLKVGKYTITSSYGGCTIKNTIKIKK